MTKINSLRLRVALRFAVLLLALALAPLSPAALILNGSFESPSLPTGFNLGAASSWSGGVWVVHNPGGIWPAAQDGNQYEDIGLNSSATLSQTFTVTTPRHLCALLV